MSWLPPVTGPLGEETIRRLQVETVSQRDKGTPPFAILYWVLDRKFERTRHAALRLAAVLLRAYEEGNKILACRPGDRGDLVPTDMRP